METTKIKMDKYNIKSLQPRQQTFRPMFNSGQIIVDTAMKEGTFNIQAPVLERPLFSH
jgi:hypothetical protein